MNTSSMNSSSIGKTIMPSTRQSGFSMIEVLVALLVLSIGLLGLAGLQTISMKYNRQSYQRTQAIFQAYDMIDRIRANPGTSDCYDTVAEGATATTGACATTFVNCATSTCNPTQLANYDINRWNTANAALLTQGKGSISTGTSGALTWRRTVTVKWVEDEKPVSLVIEVDL